MRATGRGRVAGVALLSVATLAAGCGSSTSAVVAPAGGAAPAAGAGRSTVTTAVVAAAKASVLVTAAGEPLYVFAPDHRSRVTCTATCAALWPPLTPPRSGAIASGGAVREGLLGTDPDPDGGRVVTYDGWPLYSYQADMDPDEAAGQGVDLNGGYWYLMAPDGTPVVPAGDPVPS